MFGLIDVALIMTSNHVDVRGAWAAVALFVGWGFIGAGLFAWARRPDSSVGPLMAATGFAWFVSLVSGLQPAGRSSSSRRCSARSISSTAIHMLLAAPHGQRLARGDRAHRDRRLPARHGRDAPARAVLRPRGATARTARRTRSWSPTTRRFFDLWNTLISLIGLVLIVAVLRSLVLRWRRATRPERRLYAPVYAAGVALMIAVLAQLGLQTSGSEGTRARHRLHRLA